MSRLTSKLHGLLVVIYLTSCQIAFDPVLNLLAIPDYQISRAQSSAADSQNVRPFQLDYLLRASKCQGDLLCLSYGRRDVQNMIHNFPIRVVATQDLLEDLNYSEQSHQ